jgi:hypothetical protein
VEFLNKKTLVHGFDNSSVHSEGFKFFPSVAINGFIIKNSAAEDVLNLRTNNVTDFCLAFSDFYKDLTSVQIALFFLQAKKNDLLDSLKTTPEIFFKTLLNTFMYSFSSTLLEITDLLETLPKSFIKWCIEKKVQLSELDILLCINSHPYLEFVSLKRLSHSQGLQFIELTTELLLSKIDPNIEQLQDKKIDVLLTSLKKLRYPNSYKVSSQKQTEIEAMAPDFMKNLNLQTHSDTLSINLNYNIRSIQDIKRLEINLDKIKAVYKNDIN